MFSVIACLCGGILIGYLLRRHRLRKTDNLISALIWLLVFLLGVEVGANRGVIAALPRLGLQASLLAIGSSLGSATLAWVLWRYVKGKTADERTTNGDEDNER